METLRCKFRCATVELAESHEVVKLSAVSSGSPENKAFAKYTPCGNLMLQIDNPAARRFFQPGQEYILDIRPARTD